MDLSYKSIGQLIDESITTQLKVKANPYQENLDHMLSLQNIINNRVSQNDWYKINDLAMALKAQLEECWDAQETIRSYQTDDIKELDNTDLYFLASAAITAQKTNAERCRLVREIDKTLGESARTYLEKTYA